MGDNTGLEVANIVRRVVHELDVPYAALMRLFEPLQLSLKEIEPFYIAHDGGLPRRMRGLQIGRRKRTLQPVTSDHLIDPVEASEVIFVELGELRRAQRAQDARRIAA